MASFIAGEIVAKQEELFARLCALLEGGSYSGKADELRKRLAELKAKEKIRVAFVGQYSAGKSTIVSTLTGKDIAIGTDVTTQSSTDYEWGSFLLTDTPGLQNNQTHDEIAKEAIKNADLIVYCITYELFNSNTLADYLELAYDKGYLDKMILVINKINSEETEDRNELIENYRQSLNDMLSPHSLNDVKHCFIDVSDYIKGVEKNRPSRIEKSNFGKFTALLNEFLSDNGLICKLDTPLRAASEIISEVTIDESESDEEKQMNIILSRITNDITRTRSDAERRWKTEVNSGVSDFSDRAYTLFEEIQSGECRDPETSYNKILMSSLEEINSSLTELSNQYEEQCSAITEEILQSKRAQKLFEGIDADGEHSDAMKNIKGGAKHKVIDSAVKDKAGALGRKAAEVGAKASPEAVKKAVVTIGHKIGHKFKPWEATKLAGKATKALKCLGPALEVVGFLSDIKETVDEEKAAKEQQKLRNQLLSVLDDSVKEIRRSGEAQKSEFISEVFTSRLSEVEKLRKQMSASKAADKAFNRELAAVADDISAMQEQLFSAVHSEQ